MDGPRAPLEKEFPNVVQFLDCQLRPKENWSITNEYPLAFGENNRNNIRIITEQDQVISHALIRPVVIKTAAGLFKVGGIGSVVTSTEHRNQGLSTRIINSCLDAAYLQGCDFAILWTNLYDFYRKMGFELAGSEMSILFDREVAEPGDLKIMETSRVAPEAIHRLYQKHTVGTLRSAEDIRKHLQIPNARVYTAWDNKGTLVAYAVEGKGADLTGYIHEWGGNVSNLLQLFSHIRRVQQKPVTVIAPRHAQNLLRTCAEKGLIINEGYLGMIKIVNPESLFNKIKRHARGVGIADFVLEKQEETYFIGVRDNLLTTDSEADIVRLLFGPYKASDFQKFSPQAASIMESLLPLNMWIWGWDSV